MDDLLVLPVEYRGESLKFETRIFSYGYTYRVEVDIGGFKVIFEPDEERNYRAISSAEQMDKKENMPDKDLLQAIALQLQALHQ
ncbi:hypothetical protein BDE36_2229 [Arcticibacter tournemirensis]|uniref:Uncharacterized protein n=1 Tax=Arcticibacter tournemirensis TaxID=699437 RepID=A0A5M9HE52_9SPHI|nr:hypothetical protein [Arcticibacter tournemirensis]KAA8485060.1 hypothetical protein F1649_05345 [Arcticibacter tournemirensis]TQM50483.1 hypothetical protein BDE36_2229 [Arcticibacter tournemirensis]